MSRADDERVADILDAASEIGEVIDLGKDAWDKDRIRRLAVERLPEIIGEAANSLSEGFRALHPGIPSRDILKALAREQHRSLDHIAVAHEKETTYLQTLPQVTPVEAVVRIARENYGKLPMAVASGGSQEIICLVLDHLKIRHLFQAIVTNEMVVNQKPAPDIFLEAARRIGVEPEFCRGYEDTELGLQAIRAAGMEAVDVRTLV